MSTGPCITCWLELGIERNSIRQTNFKWPCQLSQYRSNEVAEMFSRDQMGLRFDLGKKTGQGFAVSNKCRVLPKFVNRSFDRFSFGSTSNRFQTVTSRRIIYKRGRNWVVRHVRSGRKIHLLFSNSMDASLVKD